MFVILQMAYVPEALSVVEDMKSLEFTYTLQSAISAAWNQYSADSSSPVTTGQAGNCSSLQSSNTSEHPTALSLACKIKMPN